MIASNLTPAEMRKESRRLIKNLSRRISNLSRNGLRSARPVIKAYNELVKDLPANLNDLSDKDLRILHRDLSYLDSLKTSRVKGAAFTDEVFLPITDKLEALSKNLQDDFWSVYSRLYEHTSTMQSYKYDIFQVAIDYIYSGGDAEELVMKIINEYRSTLEDLGGSATDAEIKLLYTERLQNVFK